MFIFNKKILLIFNILILLSCFVIIFIFFFDKKIEYPQKKQKIIGIVPGYDLDNSNNVQQRKFNNYHKLRDRYIDSFEQVCQDKTFILLPISMENGNLEKTLSLVDGIVITGGVDLDGKFFNQETHKSVEEVEPERRTLFNLEVVNYAIKHNKGVFGICNGMQIINVARGGDLIQDIPSIIDSKVSHKGITATKIAHNLNIVKRDSFIYKTLKKDIIDVNSCHHQAVGKIGEGLSITSIAEDGIIESIECDKCVKPIIGVQWHPEFLNTEDDKKIIKAFCDSI